MAVVEVLRSSSQVAGRLAEAAEAALREARLAERAVAGPQAGAEAPQLPAAAQTDRPRLAEAPPSDRTPPAKRTPIRA